MSDNKKCNFVFYYRKSHFVCLYVCPPRSYDFFPHVCYVVKFPFFVFLFSLNRAVVVVKDSLNSVVGVLSRDEVECSV